MLTGRDLLGSDLAMTDTFPCFTELLLLVVAGLQPVGNSTFLLSSVCPFENFLRCENKDSL
jgi:hypothetical protein